MSEKYKILVTGSSGTMGTRLCERLLEEGHAIVGADWKPNKWNKDIDTRTIQIDLRDKKEVLAVLPADVDFIVHLAANARVYDLVLDPQKARDNFETLFNVLEFSRQKNVKRFIYASSREVYGNSDKIVYNEDDAFVKNCESPYTASKVGGESLVHSFRQCYGIEFIIFRFSNVYGMYDESDRIIPLFIKLCKEGRDLTVFGKEKLLDFTYIDDAIGGILSGIKKFDRIHNDVFNIGSSEGTSLLDIANLIRDTINKDVKINIGESRTGEIKRFVADISKAKQKLDFNPRTSILEGIKKSVKWYHQNIYQK